MASQASSLPATVPENEELAENPERSKLSAPASEESTMRLRLRSFARRTKERAAKESPTAVGSDNINSSTNEGDDNSAPVVTMAGDLVDHDAPQEEDEVVVEEDAQHTVVDHVEQDVLADNTEAGASSDDGGAEAQEEGCTHETRQSANVAAKPAPANDEAETTKKGSAVSEASVHHEGLSAGDTRAQHEVKGVAATEQTKKSAKSRLGGNIQVTFTEEERARYAKLGMLGTASADEKPKTERSRIYQALNPDRLYQEQEASGVSRVRGCRPTFRLRFSRIFPGSGVLPRLSLFIDLIILFLFGHVFPGIRVF